jgi:protein-disulfide isomerase
MGRGKAFRRANTLANLSQFRQQNALPRYDLERITFAQGHIRGTPGAPLRLVEFSDFQCPFCARLQPVLDQLLQEYAGKVVHYFKHAPLASIHPLAQRLHEAAECAGQQREEAFWVLHQRFFTTKTTDWDVATIRKTTQAWAQELPLDNAAFLSRFDNQTMAAVVTGNLAEFPVSGTPTLLVGDEVVEGALPYAEIKTIVERKLRAITGGGG